MDASTLHAAMQPNLSAQRAAQLVDGANDCLRRCQCTTVDRAAMLLAQIGYESVGLTASTMIDKDHGLVRWEFGRLLTTFFDSPDFLRR